MIFIIVDLVEEDMLHVECRCLARYRVSVSCVRRLQSKDLYLVQRKISGAIPRSSVPCVRMLQFGYLYLVSQGYRALRTHVMEDILYPVSYGCRAYVVSAG